MTRLIRRLVSHFAFPLCLASVFPLLTDTPKAVFSSVSPHSQNSLDRHNSRLPPTYSTPLSLFSAVTLCRLSVGSMSPTLTPTPCLPPTRPLPSVAVTSATINRTAATTNTSHRPFNTPLSPTGTRSNASSRSHYAHTSHSNRSNIPSCGASQRAAHASSATACFSC